MNAKNSSGLIIWGIGLVIIIAAVTLVFQGGKSQDAKVSTPDSDHHGDMVANTDSSAFSDLLGKPIPTFALTDRNGALQSSDTLRGKSYVLFFNEGLMCYPACWNQMVSFSKDERFTKNGIEIFSVITDKPQDWQRAIDKMPELESAKVLFDTSASVSRQFGVLALPSSMHPGSLPGHTYLAVDKEGIVRYIFDDPNMAINNDLLLSKITSNGESNDKKTGAS